jgi:diguanylate cyclase (GGDEF)-like protein/PAS domain S-box-containing protein
LISFSLVGLLTITATILVTSERAHHAVSERLNQLLDTVESTVSVACFAKDAKLADEVTKGLLKNKDVYAASIKVGEVSATGKVLSMAQHGVHPNDFHLSRPVMSPFAAETVIGSIEVDANTDAINSEIREEIRFEIFQIVVQLVLIALTISAAMFVFFVRPIKAMSDGLHLMDATLGERLARPRNHAGTEIGRLVDDINNLAGNLVNALDQERTLRFDKEQGEKKYLSIFENAETGIFIALPDGTLTSWNPAFTRLMNLPAIDQFQGALNIRQLHWENVSRIAEITLRCTIDNVGLSDELAIRLRDGTRRWLHVLLTPIGAKQLQGVVHDITEHKEAEESARRLAVTDTLTGVTNRVGLLEKLQSLLSDPLISQTGGFTLIMLDLDNFRRINEGFGLPMGDAILKGVTSRLRNNIKASDTIARLSSDRFVLLMQSVIEGDNICDIAERLLEEMHAPFHIGGSKLPISASLGITIFPGDGQESLQLMMNAELALDRAKAQGGNQYVFFDTDLAHAAEQRQRLESDLRQAVIKGEFELYYQPIVDLQQNRLAGAEALIRWNHPERGLIPPDMFIPLAEEVGVIDEIGLWVVEAACMQLAQWQKDGNDRYLSINVSGHQIPNGLQAAALTRMVAHHGIDPTRLAIEITEGVLLSDIGKSLAWLNAVRADGFRIYLDDFGTGYSSLSYLKRFPIDTLKIDKSFVRDMSNDSNDRALVEAVIAMAGSLKLKVVAEGVENRSQLELLRSMNCHYAQGYYFSRPIALEQFETVARQINTQLLA